MCAVIVSQILPAVRQVLDDLSQGNGQRQSQTLLKSVRLNREAHCKANRRCTQKGRASVGFHIFQSIASVLARDHRS